MPNLRVLSQRDVQTAIDMPAAIVASRQAYAQLAGGQADAPIRTIIQTDAGLALFMPAYLAGQRALGYKAATISPENPARNLPRIHALVALQDAETGRPVAIMDGTYLTALRTGAGSGVATELLARLDATEVAIFGSGVQARTQLEAVCCVRPIRRARVYSPTRAHAERFAREMSTRLHIEISVADTPSRAIAGAHIVCAATTSHTPVLDGRDLAPGAHVNGIGSFTPQMQEIDAYTVERARIFVDQRTACQEEAGDLIIATQQGVTAPEEWTEIGAVINGAQPGRRSTDEITFFKSVGNAAQDVATAAAILIRAETKGLGIVIAM